jgi:hypothetical protein
MDRLVKIVYSIRKSFQKEVTYTQILNFQSAMNSLIGISLPSPCAFTHLNISTINNLQYTASIKQEIKIL